MSENTGFRILVGAMNLEEMNAASIKSIESTWLQVPMSCKARGFNASPIALESKVAAPHIQNIYSAFQG